MISLTRAIAGFLADNGIGELFDGTNGDIFVEELSPKPSNAIMLLSSPSQAPSNYLNTRTLNFDTWFRNQSTKTNDDNAQAVFALLHRYHHLELSNWYIYFIGATSDIENVGRDTMKRSILRIGFQAIYIDTGTVS